MGNTTIIELNHDLCYEIERNPEKFVQQILDQLRSFHYNDKSILGGRVVAGFHRSGKVYDEWIKARELIQNTLWPRCVCGIRSCVDIMKH